MRKHIIAALTGLGVLVALFVGVSSTAVTSADGTGVTFGHSTSSTVHNADGSVDTTVTTVEPGTVDLSGKTSLVATGTTTKFRTVGGLGAWNLKIWWDDSPAGSDYRVTKKSLWNPGTVYEWIDWDAYSNNGHHENLDASNNETVSSLYISTGASTTKASSDSAWWAGTDNLTDPAGCVYVVPGSGSETGTDC